VRENARARRARGAIAELGGLLAAERRPIVATKTLQPERVELDRQAVLDLLLEASIVVDVFETLAGTSETSLTDRLSTCVERVSEDLLGDWIGSDPEGVRQPTGVEPGGRERLWDESLDGARARLRELADSVTGDVE
jgi:hypothetical protein